MVRSRGPCEVRFGRGAIRAWEWAECWQDCSCIHGFAALYMKLVRLLVEMASFGVLGQC